jgi:hypothetical protein
MATDGIWLLLPRRNLKRYLHYLTRYEAHLQSLKLEEKQRTAIDKKIDQMMEQEASVSNYSWLNEVRGCITCYLHFMSILEPLPSPATRACCCDGVAQLVRGRLHASGLHLLADSQLVPGSKRHGQLKTSLSRSCECAAGHAAALPGAEDHELQVGVSRESCSLLSARGQDALLS